MICLDAVTSRARTTNRASTSPVSSMTGWNPGRSSMGWSRRASMATPEARAT